MASELLGSPGSINEFARRHHIDPRDALSAFTVELARFKATQEVVGHISTPPEESEVSDTNGEEE